MKSFIHYTEENGLAGNIVNDVTQDRNGILWIATESGISKFDGERFQNIYKSDGLPSNLVWSIETDDKGNIYAGCYKRGLAIIRNDSVIKVFHTTRRYVDSYKCLYYSKHYKRLFVGTYNGIFMLCDSVLVPMRLLMHFKMKNSVNSICEDNSRIFFTVTGSNKCGLYELFPDTINPESSPTRLISSKPRCTATILNHNIFSAEHNYFYTNPVDNVTDETVIKTDESYFIKTIAPFGNSELIFGGLWNELFRGNILFYDPQSGKSRPSPYPVDLQTINHIYTDTRKNITWVASENGLTSIFDAPFDYYDFKDAGNILDIGFAGDSLMVLTEDELFYMNGNQLKPVLSKDVIFRSINMEKKKIVGRYGKRVEVLLENTPTLKMTKFHSSGRQLFVCSAYGAISVPDLKTYYPFGSGNFLAVSRDTAYTNLRYSNGCILCSFRDTLEKKVLRLNNSLLMDVFKMLRIKGTTYFASVYNGLYAQNGNKSLSLDENNSVLENNLTDIAQDNQGNVWCSSANGKLYHVTFTDSLRVLKVITPASSGIVGNSCKWIHFTENYLFVSTDKGINIFSLKNLYSENPSVEKFYNGYNGYTYVSAKSPASDRFGNVYVFAGNKVIKIKPEFPAANDLDINIRNVLINGKRKSADALFKRGLPYSAKNISFNFFAVKFPAANNLSYRYNVNKGEWVSDNEINLQSLRPGRYNIVMDVLDQESNTRFTKTVLIHINSPFWLSWWFLILVIAAIGSLFYLIMKIRINRLKRFHEEKAALITRNSELKLRSLQIQMSPHFIFNALTSVQKFIMTKNPEEALTYLGNLASIIRTNLENAADEYIHLSFEIDFLKKYVEIEKMRFEDKLDVNFTYRINNDNLMLPPMLVQPVIENSIKHGIRNLEGKGLINVDFAFENEALVITVEDNGVGREFTRKLKIPGHKSLGLNVIKQRLTLLNEKTLTNVNRIEITDLMNEGKPAGTMVRIFLAIVKGPDII